MSSRLTSAAIIVAVIGLAAMAAPAQNAAQNAAQKPETGETDAAGETADNQPDKAPRASLTVRQQQIAANYARLEQLLLKLSRVAAATDPQRAHLLREAAAQSRNRSTLNNLNTVVKLIDSDRLDTIKQAGEKQQEIQADLRLLLELLQSEDRAKRSESEQARIRNYLKRLDRIVREQKGVQGRTEGGDDMQRLADRQGEIAGKTEKLNRDIRENEETPESDAAPPDAKKSSSDPKDDAEDSKPGKRAAKDKPSGDKKDPADGKSDSEPPPGDAPPPGGKSPKDAPKSDAPPEAPGKDGSESPDAPPVPQGHPARRWVEEAQKKMREAQQNLEKAKRDEAHAAQREALRNLEEAKAELQRVLRQLREEEIGRVLTMLEARFRRMLEDQRAINDGTLRLSQIAPEKRDSEFNIAAGRLGRDERGVLLACDKALALLREEGTAVALPQAVEQLRDDVSEVAVRLGEAKVDAITVGIEEDIVTALGEIIDALKEAQRDMEKKANSPPPGAGQDGMPSDPPLVEPLAELRMIRSLQLRVNRRTQTYARLIQGSEAGTRELREALGRLAERQRAIFDATRDIATGKNR